MATLSIPPNERVTFRLVHEDEDLLVIDKPAGLVTQPGKGHENDTLLNGLFARFGPLLQNLGDARDFGLLHRLDKEASGLLIVALRPRAYDALRKSFERAADAPEIRKFYYAVCSRAPRAPEGILDFPLAETTGGANTMKIAHISPAGKEAITAYRVVSTSSTGALLEARPVTGRLHQIRVHLARAGAPILGDALYAPRGVAAAWPRVALHSHRVVFTHPVSGARIDGRAPLPKDLRALLTRLRIKKPV
ncbi:MAG: RluA family pseudouridine synthase [Phycisphaerae bacterium]|nr:RluA family pseudouridine synthase [Phycisphaerae bacterium]